MYTVFIDGSCIKKLGSWAAIINNKEFSGFVPFTTNNRMELFAAIMALRQIPSGEVKVFSDSQYVVMGINRWIYGWIKKGWPRRIKNKDLWLDLLAQKERLKTVKFKWIPREKNSRADFVAGKLTEST